MGSLGAPARWQRWSSWAAVPAELLLGAACHGCGEPGLGLCAACRERLNATDPSPTVPTPRPPGFPPTVTAGPYDDLLRELISAHKERQAWQLSSVLGDRLAGAVDHLLRHRQVAPEVLVLMPIPSAPAAVRHRGRDATAAIGARAAARLRTGNGRPAMIIKGLRAVRRLADQTELDAEARRRNLDGAFVVTEAARRRIDLVGGSVVLIDDLVTTGSSLAEGSRAVTEAGMDLVGAAVVAATLRRNPHPAGSEPGC